MSKYGKFFITMVVIWVGAFLVLWRVLQPSDIPPLEFKAAERECFAERPEIPGALPFKWCVHRAKDATGSVDAQTHLYHLHGRDLDELQWNDPTFYTALIQKRWKDTGKIPPTVISFSLGDVWLLAPKSTGRDSGLQEYFTGTILPTIEKRVGQPKRRMIVGESMGGINGLLLAFNARGLFEKVASLCPPIYAISPFTSWSERWEYIRRAGADPRTVLGVMILAQRYAKTEAEWKAISPIDLVESASVEGLPRIYLSVGMRDRYGNFIGAERFAALARERELPVQWNPLYTSHCGIDIPSVADFLVN